MTPRSANPLITISALLLLALQMGFIKGCGSGGGGNDNGNPNENGYSLEEAVSTIVDDVQRAHDCGDLNPPVTADDVTAFLEEEYEESGEGLTFEEFVLDQVEFFKGLADVACTLQPSQNQNLNQNQNQSANENG